MRRESGSRSAEGDRLRRRRLFNLVVACLLLLAVHALTGPSASGAASPGELVVAYAVEVSNLDPHLLIDTDSRAARAHLYDNLVTADAEGEIVPQLAERFTLSRDGKTYTFHLRKGVEFHDGTPFDAEAVKFTLDRARDPKWATGSRSYLAAISRVEVVDEHTVRVVTEKPFAPLLAHLTLPGLGSIISPTAAKKWGKDFDKHPVGTGPYRFKEWIRGDRLVFERNDKYWGPKAKVERLVYKPIPDTAARVAMLEAGDAHVAAKVPAIEVTRMREAGLQVFEQPTTRTIFFYLNTQEKPTNDLKVRQAINHAIDRQAIVRQILSGAGNVTPSLLGTPAVFGYAPVEAWTYDPAKARALVKEAGAEGAKLVLWAPKAAYPQSAEVAQFVQQQLQAVGLDVNLTIWGDQPAYQRAPETGRYNMFLLGWGNGTRDAEGTLRALFHSSLSGKPFNRSRYANPTVDRMLDEAAADPDRRKRAALYRQIQEILYRDATHVALYTQKTYYATRKGVTGVISDANEHIFFWNATAGQ